MQCYGSIWVFRRQLPSTSLVCKESLTENSSYAMEAYGSAGAVYDLSLNGNIHTEKIHHIYFCF